MNCNNRRPAERKRALLPLATTTVVLAMLLSASPLPGQTEAAPNIVFILADDMGWPDLGCYGHAFHETPVLDQLASEGVRFTNFYAATPVCSSTRSTIQTGQYSARTGITDFIPGHWRPFAKLVVPPIDQHLDTDLTTVGGALKSKGYATGYFGKWHLGRDAAHQPQHYGYDVTEKDVPAPLRKRRQGKSAGPKRIDFLTDASLWFIEQHREQPFFLTLSHHAVHIPVQAREKTIEKYQSKTKPAEGVNHPVYAAMTEDLDASVGRILDKLSELNLDDRTVVVFTSDNGGLQKTYTGVGETVSTNAPLRDEKGTLYEGGIRVPLIVRWPGVAPAGKISDSPATTADLLPTFCHIADAPLPEQPIDGISLADHLRRPDRPLDREAIYFHYPHYHHSTPAGAIRAGDWKLIEFFEDGRLELYNLREDLSERRNLAADKPDLARRLQRQLAQWRIDTGARMPEPNPKYDEAKADQWWSRRNRQPVDIEAHRKRYETRQRRRQSSPK